MNIQASKNLPFPTTDEALHKRHLDEFGYCYIRDGLSPDLLKRTRDRLIEQAEQEKERGLASYKDGTQTWIGKPRNGNSAPWQGIKMLLNKGDVFGEVIMLPRLHALMAHMFTGYRYYLSAMTGLIVRNGAPGQVIHSDQMMVPEIATVPYVANSMIMLSDFTAGNGATRLVPGSHKWGHYPPLSRIIRDDGTVDGFNTEPIETVAAEAPAGTIMAFEGRLWHGQGESTSDDVRYAISTYFAQPFVRQQDNMPASIIPDVFGRMSDELKALVGFSQDGNLGYVHPITPDGRTNVDVPTPYIPELHA